MNVSGIGVIQAQLLQNQQQYSQNSLEDILLNKYLSTTSASSTSLTPSQSESLHMDIELKDGTKISIDYTYEGMSKKTAYELGRYSDYTYGNNGYFSSENTAQRILDFARSLWDGSEEQLQTLSNAIDKGVSEALDILGSIPGWLSNILGRTEDLISQGLSDMKSEIEKAA
jgi:hypothetical protein